MIRAPLNHPIFTLAATLCMALASSAQDQKTIYSFLGPPSNIALGREVAGVGDVNRDGYDDFAVQDVNGVTVYSGRDGIAMRQIPMPRLSPYVEGVGDVNRDGFPDVALSDASALQRNPVPLGQVWVVSGRWIVTGDGAQFLHVLKASTPAWTAFGKSVAAAGDLDGDGGPDMVVLAEDPSYTYFVTIAVSGKTGKELWNTPYANSPRGCGDVNKDGRPDVVAVSFRNRREVMFLSGRNGAALFTTPYQGTSNIAEVDGVGDVDKNGYPDIVAGHPFDNKAVVVSGKDGRTILHTISGGTYLGRRVRGVGDLDGDSHPDVCVWTRDNRPDPLRAYSGKTGLPIADFGYAEQTLTSIRNWAQVDPVGDVNGDGVLDIIASTPFHKGRGLVKVFSGRDLKLVASPHLISRATGGTQSFKLDAGKTQAGRVYLLLGSFTGIKPCLPLTSQVDLCLVPDAYFGLTASVPNTFLQNSVGLLDSSGRATASFPIPAAALPALRFDHAFVVFTPSGSFASASNPVPLTL